MSDLVGNPEDRFSRVEAYFMLIEFSSWHNKGKPTYEPRHEKTGFLPMRKQRRRSAVQ